MASSPVEMRWAESGREIHEALSARRPRQGALNERTQGQSLRAHLARDLEDSQESPAACVPVPTGNQVEVRKRVVQRDRRKFAPTFPWEDSPPTLASEAASGRSRGRGSS